jgi:hypothetical protein
VNRLAVVLFFVWMRRVLTSDFRRFPALAVGKKERAAVLVGLDRSGALYHGSSAVHQIH